MRMRASQLRVLGSRYGAALREYGRLNSLDRIDPIKRLVEGGDFADTGVLGAGGQVCLREVDTLIGNLFYAGVCFVAAALCVAGAFAVAARRNQGWQNRLAMLVACMNR